MGILEISRTQPQFGNVEVKAYNPWDKLIAVIDEIVKKILCPIRLKQIIKVLNSSDSDVIQITKLTDLRKKLPARIEEAYVAAVKNFEGTPKQRLAQVRQFFAKEKLCQ